jgi:hypothetical protein
MRLRNQRAGDRVQLVMADAPLPRDVTDALPLQASPKQIHDAVLAWNAHHILRYSR